MGFRLIAAMPPAHPSHSRSHTHAFAQLWLWGLYVELTPNHKRNPTWAHILPLNLPPKFSDAIMIPKCWPEKDGLDLAGQIKSPYMKTQHTPHYTHTRAVTVIPEHRVREWERRGESPPTPGLIIHLAPAATNVSRVKGDSGALLVT